MLFINAADWGERDDAKASVKEQVDCGRGVELWQEGRKEGKPLFQCSSAVFRLPLCTNSLINT